MNKLWLAITALVLLSSAFAGCSKKSNGGGEVDAGSVDEGATYDSVLADTAYQVSASITGAGTALPTGANSSAVSAEVIDNVDTDSGGAADKADFVLDAKDSSGGQVQAVLKSMVAGTDVDSDADHQGGVLHNVDVFGASGIGPSEFPKAKAYIAIFGLSRVRIDGETVDRTQFTQVFVTKGIRGTDGALLTDHDDKDLEVHVLIGAVAGNGSTPIPGVDDGFLYYYFENVKLKQLAPADKSAVGEGLTPPEKPNLPPIVVAQVKLADGTTADNATLVAGTGPGNLTVTLDGSNSTDPDGTIEAYSWDVKEFNTTGFLEPAGNNSKPSGAVVNFTFSEAGMKAIGLRVIDADGGIANTTIYFWVNYQLSSAHNFADQQGGVVGVGNTGYQAGCIEPNNCNPHSFRVYYGANKMVVKLPVKTSAATTTECGVPHVDPLRDAKDVKQGGGTTEITIADATKLASIGVWDAIVWYERQVNCAYKLDIFVTYSPQVAPAA